MNHELPKLDAIRKMFNLSKKDAEVLAANVVLDSVVVYRNYDSDLDVLMKTKNVKVRDNRSIETVCLMQSNDGTWFRGTTVKSISDIHNRKISRRNAFYRAFRAMLTGLTTEWADNDAELTERELHIVGERFGGPAEKSRDHSAAVRKVLEFISAIEKAHLNAGNSKLWFGPGGSKPEPRLRIKRRTL